MQRHLNAALDALDDTHNLVGLADLIRLYGRVLIMMHGHEVGETRASVRRGECGFEHIGAGDVAAAGGVRVAGHYLEVAAPVPVEDSAEDSVAVEAREAAPIDRACGGHECARVHIADDAVVGDGGVVGACGHNSLSRSQRVSANYKHRRTGWVGRIRRTC